MKKFKQALSLLLTVVMVLSIIPMAKVESQAAGISLNRPTDTAYSITAREYYSSGSYHGAIDYGCPIKTPVYAAESGTITIYDGGYANNANKSDGYGWGNYADINHGNGYKTRYAHMTTGEFVVNSGDYVERGQKIGYSGNSGNSTGPHLHFGLYLNGNKVYPESYIKTSTGYFEKSRPDPYKCTCSTDYAGTYTTKNVSSSLNIRSGHSTSCSVVGSIPANATFTVLKANGTWAHVTYGSITGCVSYDYIQKKTDPNIIDTRYPTPFKAYCISDDKIPAYDSVNGSNVGNIYGNTDFCEVQAIYTNGWCKVNCPWTGYENGRIVYVKFNVFLSNTSYVPKTATAVNKTAAYFIANGTSSPGYVYVGDTCTIINETSTQYCVICPWTNGSYTGRYMVWCNKSAYVHSHSYGSWGNYDSNYHSRYCACGNMEKATHTWNSGTVTISPGCESTGTRLYTCTVCGATKTESISSTGHSFNSGVVTTAPTCTSTGVKTYTCTNCYGEKTEEIAKAAHNFTVRNTSDTYLKEAASCTSAAVYYYSCECGAKGNTTFTYGTPTEHSYGKNQYETEHPHAIYKVCEICGYIYYTGANQSVSGCSECVISSAVSSISIKTMPSKTTYNVGETFNSSGLTLTAVYTNGSSQTVSAGFNVSSPDMSTAGTKTVTVSYQGKTTSFNITVKAVEVTGPAIKIASSSALCGQQIVVPVTIEETSLSVLTINIRYDSSKLELLSVDDIPFGMVEVNKNTPGLIKITGIDSGSVPQGCVANLSFNVAATESCNADITVEVDEAYDSNDNAVSLGVVNSVIKISKTLPGDVNGDGKVSAIDARWVLQSAAGNRVLTDAQKAAADINGDGKVSAIDARKILKIVAGIE